MCAAEEGIPPPKNISSILSLTVENLHSTLGHHLGTTFRRLQILAEVMRMTPELSGMLDTVLANYAKLEERACVSFLFLGSAKVDEISVEIGML